MEELSRMAEKTYCQKGRQREEDSSGGDIHAWRKGYGDIVYGSYACCHTIHGLGGAHTHSRLAVLKAVLAFRGYPFFVFFKGWRRRPARRAFPNVSERNPRVDAISGMAAPASSICCTFSRTSGVNTAGPRPFRST